MTHTNNLDDMLQEGFSRKFAEYFLDGIKGENELNVFDKDYADWAHSQGFFATHAYSYGLNEKNVNDYLSDYDYYKIWPLNSWSRIWINDKLTLKYMFYGTQFDELMPEYYYYAASDGLKPLMDVNKICGNKTFNTLEEQFIFVLQNKKVFACKPNNGTESRGFVKLSHSDGKYFINAKEATKEQIIEFVHNNPNYLFTEYIVPNEYFAKFSKQIHTLRIITINEGGVSPKIAVAFLRFPNSTSGEANYNVFEENPKEKYNLYTNINIKNGYFDKSVKTYVDHIESTTVHPDTGEALFGAIPNYDKLKSAVIGVASYLNNVEYMGFDIGITDKGFKIMEINSHPGINTPQVFCPFYKNDFIGNYFKTKIEKINSLSQAGKNMRNKVER